MHEILAKNRLCKLSLCEIFPEHDFIVDFLNKQPLLCLFKDHKLLIKVLELISEHTAHVMRPLSDKWIRFRCDRIDDKLLREGLTENVHKNVHYCGFGKLLWAVVKASAYFD